MAEHQVQAVATGLPMTGLQVFMRMKYNLEPTPAEDGESIWTRSMDSCQAIVTFDRLTTRRTMTHLPGGDTTESFYDELAKFITEHTTIILVNGEKGSKGYFESVEVPTLQNGIKEGLKRMGKEKITPLLQWITFWTNPEEDWKNGQLKGSFVMRADGKYGRGLRG